MMRAPSRWTAAFVLVAVIAVAGIAAGAWLGFHHDGRHARTRSAYLAQVSARCRAYTRRISRIGAPSDVTAYGDVVSAVSKVVPLLERQLAAMEAVDPPSDLRPGLDRLFALDRRSIAALEAALAAARRRDAGGVVKGLGAFSALGGRVHSRAVALGIRCEAN